MNKQKNPKQKTDIYQTIKEIKVGSTDISGNSITNVLAQHNEFAIYEIDTNNIQNRIKVLIDGHTDDSEKVLIERFNKVKIKYIEAKGILLHTTNFETNKQRIAHTLSTCLNSDSDGINLFDDLITTIQKEHNLSLLNRFLYLIPSTLATIVFFIICLCNIKERLTPSIYWIIYSSLLGASLGCCVSMIIGSKKLNFQEFSNKILYVAIGMERLIFSMFTGSIAFIIIKSGLISSNIISDSYWSFMMILVIAGFSESFIPSILAKSESTISLINK